MYTLPRYIHANIQTFIIYSCNTGCLLILFSLHDGLVFFINQNSNTWKTKKNVIDLTTLKTKEIKLRTSALADEIFLTCFVIFPSSPLNLVYNPSS